MIKELCDCKSTGREGERRKEEENPMVFHHRGGSVSTCQIVPTPARESGSVTSLAQVSVEGGRTGDEKCPTYPALHPVLAGVQGQGCPVYKQSHPLP